MVEELPSQARAAIYRLIAGLLLEEVNERTLALLREPSVRDIFESLAPGCGNYLDQQWTEATFDEAAADYCELFILPGGVSPYAGAWIEGDPSTDRTQWLARIQEAFTEVGLELEDRSVPYDHVAAILLLHAAIDDKGEVEVAGEAPEELPGLIADGLLDGWIPGFSQRLENIAQNPLYLGAARLLGMSVKAANKNPQTF